MTAEREAMTLERQAFEAYCKKNGLPIIKMDGGQYMQTATNLAWSGWLAAIAYLSRAAEPVAWLLAEDAESVGENKRDPEGVDAIECLLWREQAHEQLRPIFTHPPEPARDAKRIADAVPTSWLDPLLTGPSSVIPSPGYKITYKHIEVLLREVKKRVEAAMAQESGE